MMSKKQWFVLLCLYIIYLLLGASFYYQIESRAERERKSVERIERKEIEDLLKIHYIPSINSSQEEIFEKLTAYCGKPMHSSMSKHEDPLIWDFYHSLFFVITVVSTIGYGNLAPTTMLGRIVMIFYGLVGIPINGIVMVTLGDFFGKKFTKLYNRWKTDKMHHDNARLGLIFQIILYLVPAFTLLIFIPSVVIMIFEGWDYDVAVYYAFVTLTTIGFGDYVAAVADNGFGKSFIFYEIFLLVWIIIGLGYVLMVLGFISRGLRSKKMHAIEQMLAQNIKRTPDKFRALRSLLHEILVMRVKPVYKKKQSIFEAPSVGYRSQSCPDLSMYFKKDSPTMVRKRAVSECVDQEGLPRVQSDTDLHLIDKELTFGSDKKKQQTELLLRVSNVLGQTIEEDVCCTGYNGLSDSQILESEWTINSQKSETNSQIPISWRPRACSEVKFPFETQYPQSNENTWYGQTASLKLQEMRETMKHGRARSRTLPVQQEPLIKLPPTRFFDKLRKTFRRKNKNKDIEKQDICTSPPPQRSRAFSDVHNYLADTRNGRPSVLSIQEQEDIQTIAELLVALTNVPENKPKRKLGTASLTPPQASSPQGSRKMEGSPPKRRRSAIRPAFQSRRSSMIPTTPTIIQPRRLSLRPVAFDENKLSPPPPYSPMQAARPRRFSLRPVPNTSATPSPVQRQRLRKASKDQTNAWFP